MVLYQRLRCRKVHCIESYSQMYSISHLELLLCLMNESFLSALWTFFISTFVGEVPVILAIVPSLVRRYLMEGLDKCLALLFIK